MSTTQSYIKVKFTHKDDGSLFYHHMRNYEKIKTFITMHIDIHDGVVKFASCGSRFTFELDKWDVEIIPIF